MPADTNTDHADRSARQEEDKHRRKARRGRFDQSERDDPLLLNRFEKLITWSEMVNVNRAVEDDDEADARNAAESMEELAITSHPRSASTVLKFDLDLSPEDTDPASLLAQLTYREWDYRRKQYHAAHCQIWCQIAGETGEQWEPMTAPGSSFAGLDDNSKHSAPTRKSCPGSSMAQNWIWMHWYVPVLIRLPAAKVPIDCISLYGSRRGIWR